MGRRSRERRRKRRARAHAGAERQHQRQPADHASSSSPGTSTSRGPHDTLTRFEGAVLAFWAAVAAGIIWSPALNAAGLLLALVVAMVGWRMLVATRGVIGRRKHAAATPAPALLQDGVMAELRAAAGEVGMLQVAARGAGAGVASAAHAIATWVCDLEDEARAIDEAARTIRALPPDHDPGLRSRFEVRDAQLRAEVAAIRAAVAESRAALATAAATDVLPDADDDLTELLAEIRERSHAAAVAREEVSDLG